MSIICLFVFFTEIIIILIIIDYSSSSSSSSSNCIVLVALIYIICMAEFAIQYYGKTPICGKLGILDSDWSKRKFKLNKKYKSKWPII